MTFGYVNSSGKSAFFHRCANIFELAQLFVHCARQIEARKVYIVTIFVYNSMNPASTIVRLLNSHLGIYSTSLMLCRLYTAALEFMELAKQFREYDCVKKICRSTFGPAAEMMICPGDCIQGSPSTCTGMGLVTVMRI